MNQSSVGLLMQRIQIIHDDDNKTDLNKQSEVSNEINSFIRTHDLFTNAAIRLELCEQLLRLLISSNQDWVPRAIQDQLRDIQNPLSKSTGKENKNPNI